LEESSGRDSFVNCLIDQLFIAKLSFVNLIKSISSYNDFFQKLFFYAKEITKNHYA